MRIGLYSANSVKEFQLAIGSGQYLLNATLSDGSNQSVLLNTLAQARFKINGAVIQFYQAGTYRFQASQFELIQMAHEDFCNWSVPALSTKTRAYEGDFELRIYKGNLQLINAPAVKWPEGVEGFAKYKGDVESIIYKLIGGLRSSMGYLGSKNITKLRVKPNFVKITKAGFYESMVHNVDMVKNDSKY